MLINVTKAEIQGPWLLGYEALEKLKSAVERIDNEFSRLRSEEIDREVETRDWPEDEAERRSEIESRTPPVESNVSVILPNRKYVHAGSLAEVMHSDEILGYVPEGLEIEINYRTTSVALNIEKSPYRRGGLLTISTRPDKQSEAREAFVHLNRWAESSKAPWWQRIWASTSIGFLLFLWIMVGLYALVILVESTRSVAKQQLEQAAVSLLENGIDPGEQTKAIEVLLRFAADYPEQEVPQEFPLKYAAYFMIGIIALTALYFRPSVVLGLGSGAETIKRWKVWLKIVGATVPTLIFGSFVWPYAVELIKSI